MTRNLIVLAGYAVLAVVVGGWFTIQHGAATGADFAAVYLTEIMLSLDNVTVFLILLTALGLTGRTQRRVLTAGIVLAFVFRSVAVTAGLEAVARFGWLFLVFGAVLVWTGVGLLRGKDDDSESWVVRVSRKISAPPAMVGVIGLAAADIMFALDSIPASLSISQDRAVILTANALALLGLRELFGVVGVLLEKFRHLRSGVAVVLVLIGVKLIAGCAGYHTPDVLSLVAIVIVVGTACVVSVKERDDFRVTV